MGGDITEAGYWMLEHTRVKGMYFRSVDWVVVWKISDWLMRNFGLNGLNVLVVENGKSYLQTIFQSPKWTKPQLSPISKTAKQPNEVQTCRTTIYGSKWFIKQSVSVTAATLSQIRSTSHSKINYAPNLKNQPRTCRFGDYYTLNFVEFSWLRLNV